MRGNITKHRILKILNTNSINEKKDHKINEYIDITKVGMSFDDLSRKLKLSKERILEICFALGSFEEVEPFNINKKDGISIRLKGTEAMLSKKYIIANKRILISFFEDFVKVFIPVLMALIAIFSLYFNFRIVAKYDQKYQDLQLEIKRQATTLEELENELNILQDIK